MAISIAIYSNANSSSKSISVGFEGDIVASSNVSAVVDTGIDYFFKFSTGAKSTDNVALPVKLNLGLSDLALNGVKQSAADSNVAYSTITDMITDVIYDYVNGHTADQYSSGVTAQSQMQF